MVGDELQVWGVLGMGRRVVGCGHGVPSEHRWVSGCVGLGGGVYRGVQGTGCTRGMGTVCKGQWLVGGLGRWDAGFWVLGLGSGCTMQDERYRIGVHDAR